MKIGTRLTLWYLSLVTINFLVVIAIIYKYFDQIVEKDFQAILQERAYILSLYVSDGYTDSLKTPSMGDKLIDESFTILSMPSKVDLFHYGIQPSKKKIDFLIKKFEKKSGQPVKFSSDEIYYLFECKLKGNYCYAILSARDEIGRGRLQEFEILLGSVFFAGLLITYFSGRWFSRQSLQPMIEVIDEVESINAQNLNARVPVNEGSDEISRLASTFNQMLERLEESFNLQQSFLNNASHELKTPITGMLGEIELALNRPLSVEEYQNVLHGLRHDAIQISDLIHCILGLVVQEKNQTLLKPIRFDDLIFEVVESYLSDSPKDKLIIDFDEMPENENDLIVFGHKPLLATALRNLIDNGFKYSDRQAVTVKLGVNESDVSVSVRDRGDGLSQVEIDQLFEQFYRADVHRNLVAGHGLGLSLTQRIVKLHKGQIKVKSSKGSGSDFSILIPKAMKNNDI